MKTILAFGDNLTWGFNVETGMRYAYEDRWPTVLEQGLGGAARVIAEGLGGRTTAFDDHTGLPDRNGARILPTSLGDAHAARCDHRDAREQRASKIHRKCCRSGARHEAVDRDHSHLSLRPTVRRSFDCNGGATSPSGHKASRSRTYVRRQHRRVGKAGGILPAPLTGYRGYLLRCCDGRDGVSARRRSP